MPAERGPGSPCSCTWGQTGPSPGTSELPCPGLCSLRDLGCRRDAPAGTDERSPADLHAAHCQSPPAIRVTLLASAHALRAFPGCTTAQRALSPGMCAGRGTRYPGTPGTPGLQQRVGRPCPGARSWRAAPPRPSNGRSATAPRGAAGCGESSPRSAARPGPAPEAVEGGRRPPL